MPCPPLGDRPSCLHYVLFLILELNILTPVVQLLSHVQLFMTPWNAACQASLSITLYQSLLKFMSIESVMPSNHLILCQLSSPPALNLSQHQGLFQQVSSSHQVAKVLELQIHHQSSKDNSELISFRIDLLTVRGTLKRLLQHHNSKASILQHSIFFMVQLSRPYMTTGKTIALTIHMDLCQQSDVFAFKIYCLGFSWGLPRWL